MLAVPSIVLALALLLAGPSMAVEPEKSLVTGEPIGKMGNTGKSTGTHLHCEVLRNGRDINPLDILPAGVIQIDKASTKAGQAQLTRAAREDAKPRKPKPTPLPPPADPFPFAKKAPVATCDQADGAREAADGRRAVECEPTGLFAAAAKDGPPGIPLPYRGTSLAPG